MEASRLLRAWRPGLSDQVAVATVDRVALIGVYRVRNAEVIHHLVAEVLNCHGRVALWALDEVHPDLAHMTIGSGAGGRNQLLNALSANLPQPQTTGLLIADDDASFVSPRGLADFIAVTEAGGFDVAQPAHDWHSNRSYALNLRRPWCLARRTTFVEVGPIVYMSIAAQRVLLPLPVTGMGWGTDIDWAVTGAAEGLSFGVVDATPIVHLGAVGASYDTVVALRERDSILARHGIKDVRDVQRTLGSWLLRRRTPPWPTRGHGSDGSRR